MSTDETGGMTAVAGTAQHEAAGLAHSAAESGRGLVGEAKGQAREVVHEAGDQARDLLGEARAGLAAQASEQQGKAATSLRTLGDEFDRMAQGAEPGGLATGLVRQVGGYTGAAATWLEDREPGDVLHDVADYARRHPGTFLALALGAGVLAGRLTRGLKDAPSTPSRPAAHVAETPVAPVPAPVEPAPAPWEPPTPPVTAGGPPPVTTSVPGYDRPGDPATAAGLPPAGLGRQEPL